MFLLDTNVLSDIMRAEPTPLVSAWVARQAVDHLWTASVCQAEILAGIAVLPVGRRRFGLEAAAQAMFQQDLEGRVLPFDSDAAQTYGGVFAACRRTGRTVGMADLLIASIALSRGATVVSRNVSDFRACGIDVIDPWNA